MTRKTYGLIAGAVGAGISLWWWRTRTGAESPEAAGGERVIFDNTPRASTPDGNL